MRHLSRVSTPSWSNTAPPPTIMKSLEQASVIFACTWVRAESFLSTEILRPLIPPRSLHHAAKTSAVSNSSWFRPGRPAKPGSENVAILISVGVTPWAGDPVGFPAWQTSVWVPKSADLAPPPLDAAVVVDVSPPLLLSSSRPHAAATIASASSSAKNRNRLTVPPRANRGAGADLTPRQIRRQCPVTRPKASHLPH